MMADDLEDYLQALPDQIAAEIDGAVREQAERLSEAQKSALRSQLAGQENSGALEESCRVEPSERPLEYVVKAGGEQTTTEVRAGSGEPFDYALAFEYGTTRQHARPFFWPPYRALRDDMQRKIHEAIEKAFK